MPRPLAALVLVLGCAAALPARAADPPSRTMTFHWDGGLSPYRFVTVEITSDGRASCEIAWMQRDSRSEIELSPQEVAYFEARFRRVVALERAAVEVMAVDTGITTWRMTEDGETRELSYTHTDNPWARELYQDIWRIVEREAVLVALAQDDASARYHGSHDVVSGLRQGRIFRPEDLRRPLLDAARAWPAPGLSFYHSRDSIANLLQALACCEPPEQWAGDVMELYAEKPAEARVIMLRAIANFNFQSELKDRRVRLLVPLMMEGLAELLDDPGLHEGGNVWHAAFELVSALGALRDARAVELLSSEGLWEVEDERPLMGAAASALSRIGLPGVRALVEKVSSDCFIVCQTARAELEHAAQVYAFPSSVLPAEANPTLEQVAEVREFLVERGLGPEGINGFDIADAAAAVLHQAYPGWAYLKTSEFSGPALHGLREWEYDPRKRGPQRCRLDYDGNGLGDIALLIRRDAEIKLVVLRQMSEGRWTADEVTALSHEDAYDNSQGGIVAFIAPAPPQTIIRPGSSARDTPMTLDTTGIALLRGEELARTVFYWPGDQLSPGRASP